MKVTAIILAGGKSSRMGSDKGLVFHKGKPLVEYSVNVCKEFTDQILISSKNPEYSRFGYPLIPDNFMECGPIGGLEAALSASDTDLNLICPCDMPGINVLILESLLHAVSGSEPVVARDPEGKLFPVLGVYHKSSLPVIREQIQQGDYRMTSLLNRLKTKTILIEPAGMLANFNYPEDLQ